MHDEQSINHTFYRQGFYSPLNVISESEAAYHRRAMEAAEETLGPLHYKGKIHTIMRSPYELVSHPGLLDAVEQIIGPDILLYNATYIVKEPRTPAHVSWHQDLTYWGLSSDKQVSAWIALSTADETSGCMRMIPGSHISGPREHFQNKNNAHNVLFKAQTVADIEENDAVNCSLLPGQASLHHGWTLHASSPNRGNDRRIGLNIQYISPDVRQGKLPGYSALLLRGEDRYGYYTEETPARSDLDHDAMAWRERMEQLGRDITFADQTAGGNAHLPRAPGPTSGGPSGKPAGK